MFSVDELYVQFKERLKAMAGECYRTQTISEAGQLVAQVLKEKGVKDLVLVESPLTKAGDVHQVCASRGIQVHVESLREKSVEVGAGATELNWAIAELGTLVQIGTDVDQRLASMLPPLHVALIQTSRLLPTIT